MAEDTALHKADQDESLVGGQKSVTYQKRTACRNIYPTFVFREEDSSKIDYVKIYGEARSNDCGCSYLEALADLCTMLCKRVDLSKKSEVRLIAKALRDHRCNRPHFAKPGERTLSCSDAVGRALMDVLNLTEDELRGRE